MKTRLGLDYQYVVKMAMWLILIVAIVKYFPMLRNTKKICFIEKILFTKLENLINHKTFRTTKQNKVVVKT